MNRKQLLLFGGLFAGITAVLVVAYLLLLQPQHVVLVENIRAEDAATIVAELDNQAIPYELEDSGSRVTVPEDQVGQARIAIAGTEMLTGGTVGFELFNEADMGITEFAQKVNYQRALQGELARTIMMMDGVAFARVHLSLPQRTLFRGEAAAPKAAVSVQPEPGRAIGRDRVLGIQQLVAAAVTDLTPQHVSVLDERGEMISPAPTAEVQAAGPPDERSALENYYRARAYKAAEPFLAGLAFDIRVSALDRQPTGDATAAAPAETAAEERNFILRIAVRTEVDIAQSDRADLERAIARAVGLDVESGDMIRFEVAPLETAASSGPARSEPVARWQEPAPAPPAEGTDWISAVWNVVFGRWFWLAVIVVLAVAIPLRRRSRQMSKEERASFAQLLGEHIEARGGRARV